MSLNYFNYFTEIEEEFVRRRGSHLLVSPLDWSLIETWQQRNIPLHVVLRAIGNSFETYDARTRRGRKINSLFYCQQEVEAQFLEYCESRVGGHHSTEESNDNGLAKEVSITDQGSPFSRETILQYLTEQRDAVRRLSEIHQPDIVLAETFSRAARRLEEIAADLKSSALIYHERIESDLTLIEELLLQGLRQSAGADIIETLKREADHELRSYKKGMEAAVYEQTRQNFIARKLRERFRVPRLSLFYL